MKRALKMLSVGIVAMVVVVAFAACGNNGYKGSASLLGTSGDYTFSTGARLEKVGDYKYEIVGTVAKASQKTIDDMWIDGPDPRKTTDEVKDEYILCIVMPNTTGKEVNPDKLQVTLEAAYFVANVDKGCTTNGVSVGTAGLTKADDELGWVIGLDDAMEANATAAQKTFKATIRYDEGAEVTYTFVVKTAKAA